MTTILITTLGDVLTTPEILESRSLLYLPQDEVWNLDTRAAVVPVREAADPPSSAKVDGLDYAMGMAQISEVADNVADQIEKPTPEELLEAFLFYYDNDAFIEFE